MKFYDETRPVYLETDASRIGLGTILLQRRDGMTYPNDTTLGNTILRPIAFASKRQTSVEQRHSSIQREMLGIFHGLKKFTIIALLGR